MPKLELDNIFNDQAEFMKAGDQEIGTGKAIPMLLATDNVREEYAEWEEANPANYPFSTTARQENLLKETLDLIYVAASYINTAVGPVNAQKMWNIIHKQNMSKCIDGKLIKNSKGKILKPEDFDKESWRPQFKGLINEK